MLYSGYEIQLEKEREKKRERERKREEREKGAFGIKLNDTCGCCSFPEFLRCPLFRLLARGNKYFSEIANFTMVFDNVSGGGGE